LLRQIIHQIVTKSSGKTAAACVARRGSQILQGLVSLPRILLILRPAAAAQRNLPHL
jgi:hypothetical protein